MNGKMTTLTQIDEKMRELEQVKAWLTEAEGENLVHLYARCQTQGIKMHHYITDNRDFLLEIKNYLDGAIQETGFSFSMQKMHLNSEKLLIEHHQLGTIGELYLGKKYMQMWKSPFRYIIRNEKERDRLDATILQSEQRIARYEEEVAKYQKLSAPIRKLRGFTPSKFEQMERVIQNEKDHVDRDRESRDQLRLEKQDEWPRFVERSFEFKRFLAIMEEFGFSHNFYAFEAKKSYFMRYRTDLNSSLSSVLTYEEGHLSLIHQKEWDMREADPQYQLFRFTEAEFTYLLEQIKTHFPQAKREWMASSDTICIETENGRFIISKEGFVLVHGEDINLYHLLRFSAIRKALCLLYKERTREDTLNAIKGL